MIRGKVLKTEADLDLPKGSVVLSPSGRCWELHSHWYARYDRPGGEVVQCGRGSSGHVSPAHLLKTQGRLLLLWTPGGDSW